jgi:hypothetical protein
MNTPTKEFHILLKALADPSRISLLRILYQQELTVGDLAERVNLGEPTVSHHLSRLRTAGLVTLRTAGNQRFYRVNENGLAHFKAMVADIEQFFIQPKPIVSDNRWIEDLDWPEEERKVLQDYTMNGKLIRLPGKQKKNGIILRWLATLFHPGALYSEAEVNNIIKNVYEEDFVSLRRDLIDMGYLRRERGGGKYWLAPIEDEAP